MKIQLQNSTFYPALGGIENYLYYTAKALLKTGHEPEILCSRHIKHLPAEENYENIKIIRHPAYSPILYPINPFYHSLRLKKFIEKNSFDMDVILPRHPRYAYASCKAFSNDIPVLYIQATVYPEYRKITLKDSDLISKSKKKIFIPQEYYIEKKAVELSDKVVVLSKMRKKEISDYYSVSTDKFAVVPPGIDVERFKPRKKDYELIKSLNIPENSKIMLTVCRLAKGKNVEMLIEAFSQINDHNCFLLIVGDGPERTSLEILCKKLYLTNVIFLGRRGDVERFYSIADLFVLTSKYEGFGQVFLEAMASGVPCIGLKADYPEIIVASEEIISENKTGYSADPYHVTDLVEKINLLIDDEDLNHTMGINARKVCENHYSWENHVKKLMKVIKSIKN